ncbi:MAG: NHLP bacteriocin export ABC transporter permease/ATPase subunit [Candidatus Eremiobacterota bacterium]
MDKNNKDIIKNNDREVSNIPQLTTHDSRLTELIHLGGNNPFLIDDTDYIWIIKEHKVNIYGVYLKDRVITGPRNHICTIEKGGAFFGFKPFDTFGFLAAGETGTEVIKIKIDELKEDLSSYINKWIEDLTKTLPQRVKRFKAVKPDEELTIKSGEAMLSSSSVLWIKNLKGSFSFMGRDDLSPFKEDTLFPATPSLWWKAEEDSEVRTFNTETYLMSDPKRTHLEQFHDFILDFIKVKLVEEYIDEKEHLEKKELTELSALSDAVSGLASAMEERPLPYQTGRKDTLFVACQITGKQTGIVFKEPIFEYDKELIDPVTAIARASKVRHRKLTLEKNWWKKDNGPLLGFSTEDDRPVALLPLYSGGYEMIDPADNRRCRITEAVSSKIHLHAYMFYPPLPLKAITLADIMGFGLKYCKSDMLNFLFISVIVGLLGMITPIATGVIFNYIIPSGEDRHIMELSIALFISGVAVAVFQILQSVSLIRIQGRMNWTIQSALWDRILLLPCSFFRKYSSGDLAARSLGFDSICREFFTGLTLPSLLSFIYALFNFFLLFYYSRSLAVVAFIFAFTTVLVIIFTTYSQLSFYRNLLTLEGQISGFVFQLINGITKLRVAGAESRAFTQWAEKFGLQKRFSFKIQNIKNFYEVFNSVILLISSIVIFLVISSDIYKGHGVISGGNFLAFNTAFTSFMVSVMQLGMTIALLTNVVPVVERMKPIFETIPEVDEGKNEPGEISGDIEVNHLSFRYKKNSDLILKDLTFSVKPGEFVAFVGPSGAGKSTIMRLLLGFETPEQGAIYYDGKELKELDLTSVRNQIGVVLQNSSLMAGEIYYNIIGSSLLTINDAWEAAKIAGLDEDIKAMPMGMYTYVSEGGETFSGGQKQRILIARAVSRRPKILIFDEATSALDNRTQAIVTENLDRLDITRIVVAHRISTVVKANRIYVMDRGEIVQSGTYEELMQVEGPFKDLAERQLL